MSLSWRLLHVRFMAFRLRTLMSLFWILMVLDTDMIMSIVMGTNKSIAIAISTSMTMITITITTIVMTTNIIMN